APAGEGSWSGRPLGAAAPFVGGDYLSASPNGASGMPRSLPLLQVLLVSVSLAACGEVSGGVSGAGPTASQQFELRLAVEDEVESAIAALTVAAPGLPPSF